ncbi:MAG: LLM class flavin-dependent oxidoreductase [Dehalococcoidia bacterium]
MSVLDHFSPATFPWGRRPPTPDEIIKAAQHAEKLGFYSINLPLQAALPDAGPSALFGNKHILDSLALLPLMVTATSKIRVALDAIPLPFLPPFEWAKYFATLDILSGGRMIVGMCLGFSELNFNAMSANMRTRGKVSDEQVEIITKLWTEDSVTYDGQFYHLKDVRLEPKPLQKPHPPIWWGGRQKSIPRAARYCEYINTLWPTMDEVRNEYIPQLKEETKKWGTKTKLATWLYCRISSDREMSGDEINKLFGDMMGMEIKVVPSEVSMAGSPQQCAAKLKEYMDAGIDHFVLDFQRHGVDPYETLIEQMDLFVDKVAPLL